MGGERVGVGLARARSAATAGGRKTLEGGREGTRSGGWRCEDADGCAVEVVAPDRRENILRSKMWGLGILIPEEIGRLVLWL